MRQAGWALVLLVAGGICGCDGFWDASSSGVTKTTLSSGYFYILDTTTRRIISYEIVSGVLTEVGTYGTPGAPLAIAVAPDDNYLLVSTTSGVYAYILSSGTLTLNSTAITSDPAVAIQVDQQSKWLVESSGNGYINAVPVINTTGALDSSRSAAHVPLTGSSVKQIAIAPSNLYVFVACGSSGTHAYAFSEAASDPFGSDAYTTITPVNTSGGAALSIAVDPGEGLLYIGESAAVSSSNGGLRAFTIGSGGALTELSGSPKDTGGTGPHAILPKSSGDYVYVASWNGSSPGNITAFSVTYSDSKYSLAKLSRSVPTGIEPVSLAEDSNENFVLAISAAGNPYLDAYFFDTTAHGALDTAIKSTSFAATAVAAQHY
jgi:6-phosphogluconolactonase (cycloisomerase 2 family)